MANSSPNLKVNIGADTSQFTKGVKDARRELKDFEKVGGDALGAVGNSIGINTSKLEQMASAARGMGARMKESGSEAVQALGNILSKIGGVTTALAGIGIGAAVTAFKLLNEEATAFKNTVEGANIEMMTSAYVSTYTQALHDINRATGQSVAETGAQIERGFKGAVASFKSALLKTLTGGAPNLVGALVQQIPASTYAAGQGERAAQIAGEIYTIQRKLSDELVRQSDLDAQIAEYRRVATDATESMADRTQAAALASQLIKEKYEGPNGIIALNNQLATLMEEQLSLSSSTPAAIDAANQQRAKANSLARQESQELRALQKTQNTLTAQAAKEAEERAKAAAALAAEAKAIADSRAALGALDLSTSGDLAGMLPGQLDSAVGGLEIPVKLVPDEDSWKEMENLVAGFVESVSASIGALVGDLATGGNAWGNFKNAALSAFADMAIAVGKLAISAGVATLGIKKALESLNGYAAIAAGVALVALGSAVKAGLSNIASGDYSAGASVASSGYSAARNGDNGGYTMREMTVNVTGTLKADGDQLITVINNTNKRNTYTQ